MAKYCPIMSYQCQNGRRECLGIDCAWADKEGNCLIAKALKQYADPVSLLAQGYPANQKIIEGQPSYITHWVHQDTTTKTDDGWGGF